MSAGSYLLAAVMIGPFALMTLGMIAMTVMVGPEGAIVSSLALPFIGWRLVAFWRTRRRPRKERVRQFVQ
jgi:hypothetical protein